MLSRLTVSKKQTIESAAMLAANYKKMMSAAESNADNRNKNMTIFILLICLEYTVGTYVHLKNVLHPTHRFDVTMQEANRVDALYGFQDLAPQTEGGADAECSSRHTSPQVSQVSTLKGHASDLLV